MLKSLRRRLSRWIAPKEDRQMERYQDKQFSKLEDQPVVEI